MKNNNIVKVNKLYLFCLILLFLVLVLRVLYLCLIDFKVEDKTISAFINSRNMEEQTLYPERGTIYDKDGNVLAQNVSSYKIIAYLSSERSKNSTTPKHVVDVDFTAKALSPYLNTEVDVLKGYLSKNAYQVELGIGGKDLSEIEKEEIEKLNLPGIDFIKSTKRYYPNGDFLSYTLGYTVFKNDENNNSWITGELGLEEYFNNELKGETGYIVYEKDRYGYKIANGREDKKEAINGNDLYLTIDSNIQLFVENSLKKAQTDSESEWGVMIVADAKTGAILANSSIPSFNPNDRNLVSYLDPIVGTSFEPGSTMKIFSYMCAIEKGTYDGDAKYLSGSKTYTSKNEGDSVTINDWNKKGWGNITYDEGFALSSNIAVANLLENNITKKELQNCYKKYGFGEKTGFTLKRELNGSINFKYDVEAAAAGYGQRITITPIQMIQALTAIANNGEMLKPYIVSKMVSSANNDVSFESKRTVIDTIASKNTINKIKTLMDSVVQPDSSTCTGSQYYMDEYKLIGKTGTAQIYDDKTGKYMDGYNDYIYSFSGLYPSDNPQIIIYMALKKPKDTVNYIAPAVKDVTVNISKYLNLKVEEKKDTSYRLHNYINKETKLVKEQLEEKEINVLILGNGQKIINQYPKKNRIINKGESVILLTNNFDNKMIDLTNYSYKEAVNILKMLNINYTIEGNGYVYEQSIKPGELINNKTLTLKLKERY